MKVITALSVAAALMATSGLAFAQQELSLGYPLAKDSHYGDGAAAFKETLERLSDGKFTVVEHPSSALGGERDMIEGLQIGSVDLVITSSGPLGNFVPDVLVLDLPFLFRDYEHARGVLDSEIGQEMLEEMQDHDLVGLAWSENGFRHLTNSKRAVDSPEDLQGLKVRTMENQVHMRAFESMGAAPTPMAWPEVYTALQQGTVDGQENPIPVIASAKFWEVQDHFSLTGHVYSPAIVLASPFLIDALTDEEKDWFYAAGRASAEATRGRVEADEASGIQRFQEHGMEVLTEIDKEPFQKAAAPAWENYIAERGDEVIKRIQAWE